MTTLTPGQLVFEITDESGRLTPNSWALRAIRLYDKFNATRIVVEDNAGGQMAESTIKNAVDRNLSIKIVHAVTDLILDRNPIMIW